MEHENPRARANRIAQQYTDRLTPDEVAALAETIRYEIVGALIEQAKYYSIKRETSINRQRVIDELTDQLRALHHRRLVLERTLGAKPLHRNQLVAELHRNQEEYRQLKQWRHQVIKRERMHSDDWNMPIEGD